MNLHYTPFLWIAIHFIVGLYLAKFQLVSWELSLFLFSGNVLICAMLNGLRIIRTNVIFQIRSLLHLTPFLFFAYTLYHVQFKQASPFQISEQSTPLPEYLRVTVKEVGKKSAIYRKCILQLSERRNDSVWEPMAGKILAYIKDSNGTLMRKDLLIIRSKLQAIHNKNNPGEFDAISYWKYKNIHQMTFLDETSYQHLGRTKLEWMDPFIHLRNYLGGILEAHLTGQELAIAKGLIIGDRSEIDTEVSRQFGNSGAIHILAVSGLHVAILIQVIYFVLSKFSRWITRNHCLLISLLVVWIYACMTGLSPSVTRASIMLTFLTFSVILSRTYNPYNILFFTAILLLLYNANLLYDIGFQLSYLAMFGIFLFNPYLSDLVQTKNEKVSEFLAGLMTGVSAQLLTLPMTLYYFHRFPNYFILTNTIILPLSFGILSLGMSLFTIHWIPYFSLLCGLLLLWTIQILLFFIKQVDALPGSIAIGYDLSSLGVLLLYTGIIAFYFAILKGKIRYISISLLFLLLMSSYISYTRYDNHIRDRMTFYNHNRWFFIVKYGRTNLCFFEEDSTKNDRTIHYLSEAHDLIFPGNRYRYNLRYVDSVLIQVDQFAFHIFRKPYGFELKFPEKTFHLVGRDLAHDSSENTIYAAWYRGIKKTDRYLAEGAITHATSH